jgi:hypothetical protein
MEGMMYRTRVIITQNINRDWFYEIKYPDSTKYSGLFLHSTFREAAADARLNLKRMRRNVEGAGRVKRGKKP